MKIIKKIDKIRLKSYITTKNSYRINNLSLSIFFELITAFYDKKCKNFNKITRKT